MPRVRVLSLCFALLAATRGAAAEKPPSVDLTELTLDQLMDVAVEEVYGASKYLQKTSEAPASVSIVTADAIRVQGYRTLGDILRGVRGFYVTNDRNYTYLGVRGFARPGDLNTRVLLLVDGHRINDNVYEAAPLGAEFPLDVDLIERVEVVRGPSSSIYGTGAFLGVINVVTKSGGGERGLTVATEAGNLGLVRQRLTYGRGTGHGWEFLASGTASRSDGQPRLYFPEFDSPATNHGIAAALDGERYGNLFGKLSGNGVTLSALYGAREKRIPTAAFGIIFDDRRALTVDNHGYVDLLYERAGPAGLSWSGRIAYDRSGYHGDWPYASGTQTQSPVLFKDRSLGEWWTTEFGLAEAALPKQRISSGIEISKSLHQDQRSYQESPFVEYMDDHRASLHWAVYLEDEIVPLEQVRLNLGIRYDHYESFGSTANPRLALIYGPSPGTAVKLLYGTAFRAPNAYERFYTGGGGKANPDLAPERVYSLEIVVERSLGPHLRASGSLFSNRIRGLINQETDAADSLLVYRNSNQADAQGVEVELDAKWSHGVQGQVAYALERAESESGDRPLSNSPRHLVKSSLRLPFLGERAVAGLDLEYTSARKTLAGGEVEGFLVPSASLVVRSLPGKLEAALWIENLTDHRYFDPGSDEHVQDRLEQDGRTLRFQLNRSFH